jgi:hypothetical protein
LLEWEVLDKAARISNTKSKNSPLWGTVSPTPPFNHCVVSIQGIGIVYYRGSFGGELLGNNDAGERGKDIPLILSLLEATGADPLNIGREEGICLLESSDRSGIIHLAPQPF